jgi:hypothetical protein
MTIKRIKTDVIYDHEKYGEVLVTGIGKMYNEWVVSNGDGLDSGETLVYFYDNYDGYGGMNPAPISEVATEFAKAVNEKVEKHDYIDMDYED